MKRFIAAALLAAVMVVGLSSVAQAKDYVWPHNDATQLRFQTGFPGWLDSTVTTRLGAQTCVLDTTTAFNTSVVARPQLFALTAADTNMIFCSLNVFDAGASATAADSIYVTAQASYDGVAWFTLATLIGGTAASVTSRLDQTQGTGTFYGLLNKLGASGGTPSWVVHYKYRSLTSGANDQCGIFRYPMLRWIVGFPDAVKYNVRAQVIYQSTEAVN